MDTPNKPQADVNRAMGDAQHKAAEVVSNVQHGVNKVTESVQQTAAQVGTQARETVTQVGADAARAAADTRRAMRENAYTAKEKASDSLLTAAETLRREALKGSSDEMIRQSQQLARGMEKAALYLDSHTLDQMGEDASEVVRENVWQSIGIVFILGLLLGLLLGGSRHD